MTAAAADPLLSRWQSSIADTYGTPPMVLVEGRGAQVWDDHGNEYLDLLAGIAVNSLGHAHPAIVEAVGRQLATLGHVSNLAATAPAIELAERLLDLAGRPGRVFFGNSGAEANEAAFKLSRLTGRTVLVAAQGGFHGRTMGALALTGQPAKRESFEPLPTQVRHVPFGDTEALAAAVDGSVAAVVLEPIQGEAGVIPAPPGYLAAAQDAARAAGALFILDEVQTGIGRTGRWYAHQRDHLEPDAMALAKGLGGGLPIGALVAFGPAGDLWRPGSHGSTFGGNPVSCAAALAVLDTIAADGLVERADRLGMSLRRRLGELSGVASVRGEGLLLGIVLEPDIAAKTVELQARGHGVLCNAIGADIIRLAPPLVITDAQVDRAVSALAQSIAEAQAAAAGRR